jgi:hypothetical protein
MLKTKRASITSANYVVSVTFLFAYHRFDYVRPVGQCQEQEGSTACTER